MKTKSFRKKLDLNKKTIANLDPKKMNHALGGKTIPDTEEICVTYGQDSCPTICKTLDPIGGCLPIHCAIPR
jgi:hypothetical protein